MGYEQKGIGYSLRITDREGLMTFLEKELKDEYVPDISKSLSKYWEDVIVYEDGVIESDERYENTFTNWKVSDDEVLRMLAPFMEGHIRWIGEDDRIWEDILKDGKVASEHPVWHSENFYIEAWSDEDLNCPENILDEVKEKIAEAFSDLSDRNETISEIVENLRVKKEMIAVKKNAGKAIAAFKQWQIEKYGFAFLNVEFLHGLSYVVNAAAIDELCDLRTLTPSEYVKCRIEELFEKEGVQVCWHADTMFSIFRKEA